MENTPSIDTEQATIQQTFKVQPDVYQPKATSMMVVATGATVLLVMVGVCGYYLGTQQDKKNVSNEINKNVILTPSSTLPPKSQVPSVSEKKYIDSQQRFSFNYDQDLQLVPSGIEPSLFYLETAGKKFVKGGEDYQIEIRMIDQNVPTLEQLLFIDNNSPEGYNLNLQTQEVVGKATIIKQTYKGGWSNYLKYKIYTPNLVIYFSGTGLDHDRLERVVSSLDM